MSGFWLAKDLIGQRFGKLLIIDRIANNIYNRANWRCLCDCGNYTIVSTNNLTKTNTKSCGCLRTQEKSIELREKIGNGGRKYIPIIASARRVWKSYIYRDNSCDLSFDQFYELSQQNCLYCTIKPSNQYNYFILKKGALEQSKLNGTFIYNGLDRIDPNKYHTIDNIVPCCWICNRAKNSRTLDEFKTYINNLTIKNISDFKYNPLILPENRYVIQSIKSAYRTYHKENLTLEEFYSISQMNCFYCNSDFTNKVNAPLTDKKASRRAKEEGWFHYNGLDRIDPNKPHSINNCVSCCYDCNFAKSNLSFDEFQLWIGRVKKEMGDLK